MWLSRINCQNTFKQRIKRIGHAIPPPHCDENPLNIEYIYLE